ncbi:MAG: hypothetical protein WCF67_13530 [Chitinophagaceae bacterium]
MNNTSWWCSPYWNTFWGQAVIEIFGGTTSSLLFLFLVLFLFKPKVRVSYFLCKVQPPEQAAYFLFKFVNLSFFPAYDISVELYKIRKIPMGDRTYNNEFSRLSLVNANISHVAGRSFYWNKKPDNPHCVLIRSVENLSEILSDEMTGIVLKISLKHGLTGLSKVFEREYCQESDIKKGKFKSGTKFGVI